LGGGSQWNEQQRHQMDGCDGAHLHIARIRDRFRNLLLYVYGAARAPCLETLPIRQVILHGKDFAIAAVPLHSRKGDQPTLTLKRFGAHTSTWHSN